MANNAHANGRAASNGATTAPAAYRNGHAPSEPAGIVSAALMWDGLPPSVVRELEGSLDPSLVSRRRGRAGQSYDYMKGHVAIAEANRIFGYGGWGYEVAGDVGLTEIETVDSETGEIKTVRAYSAPVRVTVPGAPPRTDVGFHSVVDDTAEGHETACKGAVTDGMKRALRSFGDGLYGPSQPAAANSGSRAGASEAQLERLRARLLDLGDEQGFDEDAVRAAVRSRTGRDLDDLPASDLEELVDAAYAKTREMRSD
ncbi:MAG: hypothetical protein F4169_05205 [Gammaproteobacteria bacterium]|nr:hypothetical protein [Chloroflexota bacterium]MYF28249.1 hypothetical protein [Gammaproteobacteria bacterium]MYK62459.1 hypothetical protein [Chloroflexota bacterium]